MIDQESVPSKKAIAFSLFFVLLVSTAFIPAKWFGVTEKKNVKVPVDLSQFKSIETTTKDVNGDGKLTWREVISSTEEGAVFIKEAESVKPDENTQKALSDPNNLTAAFSKNLFLTSTYLKNNNVTDEESQQKALDGIMADTVARTASKKYIYNDLHIAQTENRATLKAYGNEVAKTIDGMITEKNIKEDLPGMLTYLDTANEEGLVAITKDAARIATINKKLLAIQVPPSASANHILLLNKVEEYKDTLSSLSTAPTDPMRAAAVIQKYPDVLVATLQVYKDMTDYFNLKNIAFNPQEPGYVFTVGFTLN